MEKSDIEYEPCKSCVLLNDCLAKGDKTKCGYAIPFENAFQTSQGLLAFLVKKGLHDEWKEWKKNATVDIDEYKEITGHDWIHKQKDGA